MPLVSVVIPSYNCAPYIGAALDSILSWQTLKDIEVIVVDDGSTDNTREVIEPYRADPRVRYCRQPNRGASASRNTGALEAVSEFVAFLDADDQWAPEALGSMREALLRSGHAWCINDVLKVYTDRSAVQKCDVPASDFFYNLLEDDYVRRGMFFRRSEFLAVGMYDEQLKIREDWDINIRMLESGRMFTYLEEPLYLYTWREGSLTTASQGKIWSNTERLLRKHHKRLADSGDTRAAGCYARRMWDLARRYVYNVHDPGRALRCAYESLRYDFALDRLVHPLMHRIGVKAKP